MPKINEIESAWLNFVQSAIGLNFPDHTAIFSQQDGPRPDKPYLTLKLTGPFRVTTTDPRTFDSDSNTFKFAGYRRFNLSIQSYGLENLDVLDEIILGTQDPEYKSILKDCDIGIESRGNVTDITSLISTKWEKRGSLDISFITSKIKLTNIGLIESAEIDGEVENADGSKTIINKFTVPEP